MADRSKIEKMLELLINEDQAAAEELFHEFVVQKSRDIYESMLEDEDEEDEDVEEAYDDEDEDVEEADEDEDDDETNEGFNMDQFEVEADDDIGGDPTDDMMADLGMDGDEEGDDMDMDMDMDGEEGEGDVEDRVVDLEDALEDLKAEFERMMSGEEGEDHDMDMDGDEEGDDMDMDMDDDDMDMDDGEEEKESYNFESVDKEAKKKATDKKMADKKAADKKAADKKAADKKAADKKNEGSKSSGEQMREYVEKVTSGHGAEKKSTGDNGQNTKSAVAKPNNMGGSTASTVRSDVANDGEAGANSTIKGSALSDTSAKDMSTGNINVPGGKAGKANKAVPKGHGAEKKGPGEKSDKSTTSTVNKLSSRAK